MRTLRDRTLWLFERIAGDNAVKSWHEHTAVLEAILSSDRKLAGLLAARHVRRVGSEILKVIDADEKNLIPGLARHSHPNALPYPLASCPHRPASWPYPNPHPQPLPHSSPT